MLKLCENSSNIDYLYETSSVLRKATETKISGLTFWLRFGKTETEPKFGFRTSLPDMTYNVFGETLNPTLLFGLSQDDVQDWN